MEDSCRLCLQEVEDVTNVFEFEDGRQIADLIQVICSLKIHPEDLFSKSICAICLDIVNRAHELRLICIKNDLYLKEQDPDSKLMLKIEDPDDLIEFAPSPLMSDCDEKVAMDHMEITFDVVEVLPDDPPTESYHCDSCPKTTQSKRAIETHIQSKHSTNNVCGICGKHLCSLVILRQHMRRQHLSEMDWLCKQCNIRFNTQKKFELHKQVHSFFFIECVADETSFQCRLCPRRFTEYNKKMVNHIMYHKMEKKAAREESESLVCPQCGQIYRTKQILQQHIKRHSNTSLTYECEKCPQKFKSWGELYYHKDVHTTEKNYVCEICSKAFKSKRGLRTHKIRHETKDVKNFQCPYCQLKLKSRYTLNRHILIHTGEKPHACSFCEKSFTQKNELNKHLRVHVGENTYKCEEFGCSEAFRLLAELRLHKQIHYDMKTKH